MRRLVSLAALFIVSSAYAGTTEQYFGAGVLGVKWDATLSEVQVKFPDGFTWETAKVAGTEFAHTARVDTDLFDLDSRDLPIHFYFDKAEKLSAVSIFFPYHRKDDVFYQIAQALGQNYHASSTSLTSRSSWPSQSEVRVSLSIGHREPHKWVVLQIYREESRAQ